MDTLFIIAEGTATHLEFEDAKQNGKSKSIVLGPGHNFGALSLLHNYVADHSVQVNEEVGGSQFWTLTRHSYLVIVRESTRIMMDKY